MPNEFMEQPVLPPLVLPVEWTCPITRIRVPKEAEANLKWRLKVLEMAEADPSSRTDLFTACSQSVLLFINAFVYTIRVFEASSTGENVQAKHQHVPFCTWPIQDELITLIEKSIDDGKELLTDKSRDAGATWCHLAVLVHRLLFRADESHLLISRKEDAVDMLDGQAKNYPYGTVADPGTLFGKIDYVLSRLPEWMVPKLTRKAMHVVNAETKTRLDGESSNASAGSSDRRKAIYLDEFSKCAEAESIKRSTRDVTACRLVCSTPNGAGTAFSKWRMSGQIPVFSLMWWDIPGKGEGRYAEQDRLGRWKIKSPWYNAECARRSPQEIAIEIDANHIDSGMTFFEGTILEAHKRMHCRPPKNQCSIVWRKKLTDDDITRAILKGDTKAVAKTPYGPLKLWVELIAGRLDQSKTYVISIDISKGQGASNSVMNIGCVETREKVAEWSDANTPPYELARLACALAVWVGGRGKRPLVCWENNGDPGLDFGRQLVHTYKYPNVYFDKATGTLRQRVGKRYGWRSNTDKKAEALGLLRRAYALGKYVNRSAQALQEAATYIHYETGGIGPAELVNESPSARKCHGDRVIADMLFIWCLADAGRISKLEEKHPKKSVGGRFAEWKKQKKERSKPGRTFNLMTMGTSL